MIQCSSLLCFPPGFPISGFSEGFDLFFFVSHLGLRIVVSRGLPFHEGALCFLCEKVLAPALMRVKILRLLFVHSCPHHHGVALKIPLLYRERSAGFAVGRQQDP